jgi:hypothetical protein
VPFTTASTICESYICRFLLPPIPCSLPLFLRLILCSNTFHGSWCLEMICND